MMPEPTIDEIDRVEEYHARINRQQNLDALMEEETKPMTYRGILVDFTWTVPHLVKLAEYLLIKKMTYDVGCEKESDMRELLGRKR
jgi:hypothetical protein